MLINSFFKIKMFVCLLLCLVVGGALYGQSDSTTIKIYFKQGRDVVNSGRNLYKLDYLIDSIHRDTLTSIKCIVVESYTSPEGTMAINKRLSQARGESVRRHLTDDLGVADSLIVVKPMGVAWSELDRLAHCQQLTCAADVRAVIASFDEVYRNAELKRLDRGAMYEYLFSNVYPLLRRADVTVRANRRKVLPIKEVWIAPQIDEDEPVTEIFYEEVEEVDLYESYEQRPLFAIKTNLLFDLFTLVNIELEVPIKRRWSVAGEFVSPWWTMDNHKADSRRNRVQLQNWNLEGRYWWGERESRPILTGWFTGLYSGVGLYDLEWRAKGYQGEFFIALGLSGGYAHTINRAKSLRMEYSLGVGYMRTNYKYYHAEFCSNHCWHAIEQRSGRYTWFGPTRAKVSLSWLIDCKSNRRR